MAAGLALLDLTMAAGLAAATLASGVGVTARSRAQGDAIVEEAVAREAAEGLLDRAAADPPAPGVKVLALDGLPSAARLPGVRAVLDTADAGPGLRRLAVTFRWKGSAGPAAVRLDTVARVRGP
ncbi:MAG: hypothetical protein L0216_07440 [Planctomycetales bacterium]|nr:hypothetical protein [Planctomycetales bacterium]